MFTSTFTRINFFSVVSISKIAWPFFILCVRLNRSPQCVSRLLLPEVGAFQAKQKKVIEWIAKKIHYKANGQSNTADDFSSSVDRLTHTRGTTGSSDWPKSANWWVFNGRRKLKPHNERTQGALAASIKNLTAQFVNLMQKWWYIYVAP